MKQPIVSRRPDVMGGTAVFHGTRVPVQTLLDYLEAGESIDDFLEGFPSVTRDQVIAFLEEVTKSLKSPRGRQLSKGKTKDDRKMNTTQKAEAFRALDAAPGSFVI